MVGNEAAEIEVVTADGGVTISESGLDGAENNTAIKPYAKSKP